MGGGPLTGPPSEMGRTACCCGFCLLAPLLFLLTLLLLRLVDRLARQLYGWLSLVFFLHLWLLFLDHGLCILLHRL